MDDDDFLVEMRKPTSPDSPGAYSDDLDDFVDLEAEPGIGFHKGGATPTVRHFHEIKARGHDRVNRFELF